jgi:hypothetical protein
MKEFLDKFHDYININNKNSTQFIDTTFIKNYHYGLGF